MTAYSFMTSSKTNLTPSYAKQNVAFEMESTGDERSGKCENEPFKNKNHV